MSSFSSCFFAFVLSLFYLFHFHQSISFHLFFCFFISCLHSCLIIFPFANHLAKHQHQNQLTLTVKLNSHSDKQKIIFILNHLIELLSQNCIAYFNYTYLCFNLYFECQIMFSHSFHSLNHLHPSSFILIYFVVSLLTINDKFI